MSWASIIKTKLLNNNKDKEEAFCVDNVLFYFRIKTYGAIPEEEYEGSGSNLLVRVFGFFHSPYSLSADFAV